MTYKIAISIFSLFILLSCSKDNVDFTMTNEGEVDIEIIDCSLKVDVESNFQDLELIAMADFGIAPYEYLWSTGSELSSIQNISNGEYIVVVTDSEGCEVSSLVYWVLIIDCGENIGVLVSHDKHEKTLTCTIPSPFNYLLEWSTGESAETIVVESGLSYTVQVSNNLGCGIGITYDVP